MSPSSESRCRTPHLVIVLLHLPLGPPLVHNAALGVLRMGSGKHMGDGMHLAWLDNLLLLPTGHLYCRL